MFFGETESADGGEALERPLLDPPPKVPTQELNFNFPDNHCEELRTIVRAQSSISTPLHSPMGARAPVQAQKPKNAVDAVFFEELPVKDKAAETQGTAVLPPPPVTSLRSMAPPEPRALPPPPPPPPVPASELPSGWILVDDALLQTSASLQPNLVPSATVVTMSKAEKEEVTAKSLFICIAVVNPFDPRYEHRNRIVSENIWYGNPTTKDNPSTFLADTDYLLEYTSKKETRAPTNYQKVIDMLLRFNIRKVEYDPPNMLERIPEGERVSPDDPNQFHGYRLAEQTLLKSPDEDEIYIKVHCSKSVLLQFAEKQGFQLATNPYSQAGGIGMVYTEAMEKVLSDSVLKYSQCYPGDVPPKYLGKKKPWGFYCEVPQKMTIFVSYLSEAWEFGGCGILINEMKFKDVFVKQFFPLHNDAYFQIYGLAEWARLRRVLSINPWRQDEEAVVQYFGPQVGLYFTWIRSYTLSLAFPAVAGVVAGIVILLDYNPPLVNGVFAVILVIWSVAWSKFWDQRERLFVYQHNQNLSAVQELVRDQFKPDRIAEVSAQTLYQCKFSFPLTLRRKADGTMVELQYNTLKRLFVRAFFTYPVVILISAAMLAVLTALTNWRFQRVDDFYITYGSSVIAVVVSVIFGFGFDLLLPKLNAIENNRTESEEETQFIIKSMIFYFPNSYFALFAIALHPDNAGPVERLKQLFAQMLVICVIKPIFVQIQEYLQPILFNAFRRRRDKTGSACMAIVSMLFCQSRTRPPPKNEQEAECRALWRLSQREPYMTTAADCLTIILQFGYMAMFASVFPWSPLAALFYNTIELRLDAKRLYYHSQRPFAKPTAGIGPWKITFWVFTGMSVITNSYLICMMSDALFQMGVSKNESDETKNMESRLIFYVLLQYGLVAIISVITIVVRSEPKSVQKEDAKHSLFTDVAIRHRLTQLLESGISTQRRGSIDGDSWLVIRSDE
jgi:hypothetical protein